MPPPDQELKWCAKCYAKVFFYHGVCEWADTHHPPDDDDSYARRAEDDQRRRDAAEGFED